MPEQLFLDLPTAVPRLPASLRPMLESPANEPFDSPDHLFEPSWGGLRALAFVEPDPATGELGLRLLDAAGMDVAPRFPELRGLPDALASPFAILDGEVIVPDGSGHADTAALAGRLSPRSPAAGRARGRRRADPSRGSQAESGTAGAVYLAFDLLYADGRPLLGQPLAKRRQLLASLVAPTAEILVVPAVAGEGRVLFEAAATQKLPGILARHARGPYLAGRQSGLWRSISTAGSEHHPVSEAEPLEAGAPGSGDASRDRRRPLLALIRRLPLPFDPD